MEARKKVADVAALQAADIQTEGPQPETSFQSRQPETAMEFSKTILVTDGIGEASIINHSVDEKNELGATQKKEQFKFNSILPELLMNARLNINKSEVEENRYQTMPGSKFRDESVSDSNILTLIDNDSTLANNLKQRIATEEHKIVQQSKSDDSASERSKVSNDMVNQMGSMLVKRLQSKKSGQNQGMKKSFIDPADIQKALEKNKSMRSSILNKSVNSMKRSVSGFDLGQKKTQGSFYSSVRQSQMSKSMKGIRDTTQYKGKKFIESTINQQGQRYEKKFPFERGQYHQCIPNPNNPSQRISVQLVERVIDEFNNMVNRESDIGSLFDNDQIASKSSSLSQTYERFNLVPPDEGLDNIDGSSSSSSTSSDDEKKDSKNKGGIQSKESIVFGADDQKLYKPKSLFQEVDKLLGVQNQHYANISQGRSNDLSNEARQNCKEFAVVAFWDLDETNVFVCSRFFIIPNPIKRIIRDVEGTVLHQVLFYSQHSNDVFFFWKGKDKRETISEELHDTELSITFLKLDWSDDELSRLGDMRNLFDHCKDIHTIDRDSLLATYINQMHEKPYGEQEQSPNPVIIEELADTKNVSLFANEQPSKYLVFTAFLLQTAEQEMHQPRRVSENRRDANQHRESWYPTIHFYDVVKKQIVWQVYGASQFMAINRVTRNVKFLTNDIWSKMDKLTYKELRDFDGNDFTRHKDFASYFREIAFFARPITTSNRNMSHKCPDQPFINSHKLTFGKNKDLGITEPYKVVSSYIHHKGKRATLIYHGLGSFTFLFRNAISLIHRSHWRGSYSSDSVSKTFNCQLSFSQHRDVVKGEGTDENDAKVTINIRLRPENSESWAGYFETSDLVRDLSIPELTFNDSDDTIHAFWHQEDGREYNIEGQMGRAHKQRGTREIEFTLTSGTESRLFKGKVDLLRSQIKGQCSENASSETKYGFKVSLQAHVRGALTLRFGDGAPIKKEIVVDYLTKRIISAPETDYEVEIQATEAMDQAEIVFAILQQDTDYVDIGGRAYIQAKLVATAEEDSNTNGTGVTETRAILYCVDAYHKQNKKDKQQNVVVEPKDSETVRFFLNQSFLRTQSRNDHQLWHAGPSYVKSEGMILRLFGSVLFEECGSGEVKLNMFSAEVGIEDDQELLDYPQEPVPQSWIVDYPLLAYKTFTPRNKEVAIVHMAYNTPQRILHLGEWEFVCFVNHTQMVEQKCFKKSKETNCDIMILVKRNDKCRLMSFKTNPWLQYHEAQPKQGDSDICKQAFFIFSGDIGVIPTEDWNGNEIEQNLANHIKHKQRYNNDKVQACHLITKTLGNQEQYMLIIQFNDCIVQASLNRNFFKLVCQPETMIRRHLVRGYNEKIFFAENSGSVDKIFQIELHPTKNNEITKKEIYQLAGGKLVAFEFDSECIQNDMQDGAQQSFFIMDDQQKIYLLQNSDNVKFVVKKVIDFTRHNEVQEVNALLQNEWAHVHVTERTLTLNGKIYNLKTQLSMEVTIPKSYFGRESSRLLESSEEDSDNSSSSEIWSDDEDGGGWQIETVEAMSMTTNMLVVGQRNQREFCFVLKQAPGTRKVSIVGFQQLHEIEQMLFVSNTHVLLNFRGGKSVTLLSNGSIINQELEIQMLLENSERVIAESQLYQGKKSVLLEDDYVDEDNKDQVRHITLQFDKTGAATLVGIFDDYKKQITNIFEQRTKVFLNQAVLKAEEQSDNPVIEIQNLSDQFDSQARMLNSDAPTSQNQLDAFQNNQLDASSSQLNESQSSQSPQSDQEIKLKKIKYAKEFFITDLGETIKMAAIISTNPEIREKLKTQKALRDSYKKKKSKSGTLREHYISIIKIQPNKKTMATYGLQKDKNTARFTVIVFHCIDDLGQEQFVNNTQYCVVGNYLCHRRRDEQEIWVSKLKQRVEDFIQPDEVDQESDVEKFYSEYKSVCISIDKMTRKVWLPHIQLTEVPKSQITTIKSRHSTTHELEFHDAVLQVTIGTNGMIFALDSDPIKELDTIENIDTLMKLDTFVNTGFIMSISYNEIVGETKLIKRKQIFQNEYNNLFFEKQQRRLKDGSRVFDISGMLYQTFSDIDLWELNKIQQAIDDRQKITQIDPETILSIFEGHSIFSIFFDRIQVYEQILGQLKDMEFNDEDDINSMPVENSFLKRLHRILNMPTGDLANSKDKYNYKSVQAKADRKKAKQKQKTKKFTKQLKKFYQCKICCKKKEKKVLKSQGFSQILKKSLDWTNARFRESLMEMSMLCRENAINNFVDNLDDIQILFTSMSPSVVALFEDSFKKTRFTDQITNADWRIGDDMEVIGSMSSVVMEKSVNKYIQKQQKKILSEAGDVQNRQVEARMLQIDWIFAQALGKQKCGFADFVVLLGTAPHESLFSTDLIKTLVNHFWSRYYRAVIFGGFIPFLIYFLSLLFYVSNYAVIGIDVDFWEPSTEFFLRWVVIFFILYFFSFEIRCIIRDKHLYLLDIFNYVDVTSFGFNIYLVFQASKGKHQIDQLEHLRTIGAIAVLLVWFKAFYWLRLFGPTSFFVRMIVETLYDIRYFLILFILILMTFGNALLVLNQGRLGNCPQEPDEDAPPCQEVLYKDYFELDFASVMLNQYELALGEFDTEDRFLLASQGNDFFTWILFIASTMITQIMFLNMLIAIMGDTFERVTESREQSALVEKIGILADYVFVVPKESEKNGTLNRFLFAIRPQTLGADELGSWEGTATMLKNSIEEQSSKASKAIMQKIGSLQGEFADGNKKIAMLEERMSELQGSSQRQQGMIEQVLQQLQVINSNNDAATQQMTRATTIRSKHAGLSLADKLAVAKKQQNQTLQNLMGGGASALLNPAFQQQQQQQQQNLMVAQNQLIPDKTAPIKKQGSLRASLIKHFQTKTKEEKQVKGVAVTNLLPQLSSPEQNIKLTVNVLEQESPPQMNILKPDYFNLPQAPITEVDDVMESADASQIEEKDNGDMTSVDLTFASASQRRRNENGVESQDVSLQPLDNDTIGSQRPSIIGANIHRTINSQRQTPSGSNQQQALPSQRQPTNNSQIQSNRSNNQSQGEKTVAKSL